MPVVAQLSHVSPQNVSRISEQTMGRPSLLRGLGRSYGDAAQISGGSVFQLADDIDAVELDESSSRIRCPAGVTFDTLLRFLVPRGFFVPVTPGTRFVTVGGAVASDIHGKNHHVDGSFGHHVEELTLLLADGSIRSLSPHQESDLFWATVGGMGLTGAILEVTFGLLKIETSMCTVETIRCANIDDLIETMSVGDDDVRYSVAWTDLLSTGRNLGRSILWRGDHSRAEEIASRGDERLEYRADQMLSIPNVVPSRGVVNKLTSKVFNELWYRRAPKASTTQIKSIPAYFHPLDAVGDWNRLYGRSGFLQYQFVLPFGHEDVLRSIVDAIAHDGNATPLVVLKRFGAGNNGMLSFPMPGWTLTVDFPAAAPDLPSLLRDLDELVLSHGGRHYLAKDAHAAPDVIERGYPRLDEWRKIKHKYDPTGVWTSDLARRLRLVD